MACEFCEGCILIKDDTCPREERLKREFLADFVEELVNESYEFVTSFSLYSEGKNKTQRVVDVETIQRLFKTYVNKEVK